MGRFVLVNYRADEVNNYHICLISSKAGKGT